MIRRRRAADIPCYKLEMSTRLGPSFLLNNTARPGIMARRALGITRKNNYPHVGQWVLSHKHKHKP